MRIGCREHCWGAKKALGIKVGGEKPLNGGDWKGMVGEIRTRKAQWATIDQL